MNEDMDKSCEQAKMPSIGGMIGKKECDPVTEKLREVAVDSLNIYLIRLLEKKDFYQAQRIFEVLRRIV